MVYEGLGREAAQPSGRAGVLSRLGRLRPRQLSRREAVSAQPAVVGMTRDPVDRERLAALRRHRRARRRFARRRAGPADGGGRPERRRQDQPAQLRHRRLPTEQRDASCIDDTETTHAPAHTAAKRGIARTFQHNELFPQLTTLENLLLGRHAMLEPRSDQRRPVLRPLPRLGTGAAREGRGDRRILRARAVSQARGRRPALWRAEDHRAGARLRGRAAAGAAGRAVGRPQSPGEGRPRALTCCVRGTSSRRRMVWIEHDMQLVRDLADRVTVLHYGTQARRRRTARRAVGRARDRSLSRSRSRKAA